MRQIPWTHLLTISSLFLVSALPVAAATVNVPADHATLSAALAGARSGDIIEIAPGTYTEHDLVVTVAVTIRGLGEQATDVVIDAEGAGRVLSCENVAGTVRLQNVTLRGGRPQGASSRQQSGGAVLVSRSQLIAANCVFADNMAAAHGGAIRFIAAGGRIMQCRFTGNRATYGGGAIDCSYGSSPIIERCTFETNEGGWGGGLSCRVDSSPQVGRSVFTGNRTTSNFGYGGGIFADLESAPRVEACTLTGNRAAFGGALGCFQGSRVAIERCTIADNSALGAGAGVYCIDGSPRMTASIVAFQDGSGVESIGLALPELGCSNIYGNVAGDVNGPATGVTGAEPTISADPLFCSDAPATGSALLIAADSPSAAGSCGPMGAWPVGCSLPTPTAASFQPVVRGVETIVTWTTNGDHPGASYRLTWARPGEPAREVFFDQTAENTFVGRSTEPAPGDTTVVFNLFTKSGDGNWQKLAEGTYGEGSWEIPPLGSIASVRNWPNPFNPETTIGVTVSRTQRVRVAIHGLDGRRVRVLADRVFATGEEELVWNGLDDRGQVMSSGPYFVRVTGESETRAHKITLLK